MFFRILLLLSFVVLLNFGFGCGKRQEVPVEDGKIKVSCLIAPISWIAAQIGGDYANCDSMIPDGENIHAYNPTPQEINRLQSADYYLLIGLPIEYKTISKVLKDSEVAIVDVTSNIKRRKISGEENCDDCGHDHGHDHKADEHEQFTDTHLWLSPPNNLKIAKAICDMLVKADPANEAQYQKNLTAFTLKINDVDSKLKQQLAPLKGQKMMVYHPAFGYFSDYYGMIQTAVETGGKSPTPKQLENILNQIRNQRVKVILVQPQFPRHSAKAISAATGAKVITVDPIHGNVLETYQKIANALTEDVE